MGCWCAIPDVDPGAVPVIPGRDGVGTFTPSMPGLQQRADDAAVTRNATTPIPYVCIRYEYPRWHGGGG